MIYKKESDAIKAFNMNYKTEKIFHTFIITTSI